MNSMIKIKDDFSVFCGAGISFDSKLPIVTELIKKIIEGISGSIKISEKLFLDYKNNPTPFESFMEVVLDGDDSILDLFKIGEPNSNHFFIASLIKEGVISCVYTTNFDCLIEKALSYKGMVVDKDYSVIYDEDGFFNDKNDALPKIYKVHGSVGDTDRHRKSIRATISSIAKEKLQKSRRKIIRNAFNKENHSSLLVIGYSFSDVFDINDEVLYLKENDMLSNIFYLDHQQCDINLVDNKHCKNNFFIRGIPGQTINGPCNDVLEILKRIFGVSQYSHHLNDSFNSSDWEILVRKWCDKHSSIELQIKRIELILKYNKDGDLIPKELCDLEKSIKDTDDIKAKAKLSLLVEKIYRRKIRDFKKAKHYIDQSILLYEEINDRVGLENAYFEKLRLVEDSSAQNISSFSDRLRILDLYLPLSKEVGDNKDLSISLHQLAHTVMHLGYYDIAIEFFRKSLGLKNDEGYKNGVARSHHNIGICYRYLWIVNKNERDYSSSIKEFNVAKDIYEKMGNTQDLSDVLYHMALLLVFDKGKTTDECLDFIDKSINLRILNLNSKLILESRIAKSYILYKIDRVEEARFIIDDVISVMDFERDEYKNILVFSLYVKGKIISKESSVKANFIFHEALKYADNIGSHSILTNLIFRSIIKNIDVD